MKSYDFVMPQDIYARRRGDSKPQPTKEELISRNSFPGPSENKWLNMNNGKGIRPQG